MERKNEKVLIGMSGGVDSAVAAAILKDRGYTARGVFLILHDDRKKTENDLRDLEKISRILGIECEILDVRERFKREVVEYFLSEYAALRTPNPCVFCNENFKFKILLEEADRQNIPLVSTGHYALTRKLKVKSEKLKVKEKTIYKLFSAKDKNKDQSYFLYRLGQKELAKIIFPLGEYEKTEVRKLAKKLDLPVSEKKESQDVCFLSGLTTEMFLKKNLKLKKGKIVDPDGKILGEHQGLPLYTLGQRKGINIGGTGPYYVVGKDRRKNELVVTNDKKEASLFLNEVALDDVTWTFGKIKLPVRVRIETRYRELPIYATIKPPLGTDGKYAAEFARIKVEFEKPHRRVASGQSVVFYAKNGEVLGGGIVS